MSNPVHDQPAAELTNGINGVHHEHDPKPGIFTPEEALQEASASQPQIRRLKPGIYAPIPTFFHPNTEDLDLETFTKHVLHIAKANVGLVIAGSMGEAHHLSNSERALLISTARRALDSSPDSLSHVPIIAGVGIASTRGTIQLAREAKEAGADYAIVIASGYFAGALASDQLALKQYWADVAKESPLPVIIYNFPAATGGIDLDSDLIVSLVRENPTIVGVKLTCGNVGKLTRIASVTSHDEFANDFPRKLVATDETGAQVDAGHQFLVWGGFIDFLVPSAYARAHGAITGLANLAPYAIARMFDLVSLAIAEPSNIKALREAQRLQDVIGRADRTIALAGVAGTKYLMDRALGYGGTPRRPLLPTPAEVGKALWAHQHVVDVLKEEESAAALAAQQ